MLLANEDFARGLASFIFSLDISKTIADCSIIRPPEINFTHHWYEVRKCV